MKAVRELHGNELDGDGHVLECSLGTSPLPLLAPPTLTGGGSVMVLVVSIPAFPSHGPTAAFPPFREQCHEFPPEAGFPEKSETSATGFP